MVPYIDYRGIVIIPFHWASIKTRLNLTSIIIHTGLSLFTQERISTLMECHGEPCLPLVVLHFYSLEGFFCKLASGLHPAHFVSPPLDTDMYLTSPGPLPRKGSLHSCSKVVRIQPSASTRLATATDGHFTQGHTLHRAAHIYFRWWIAVCIKAWPSHFDEGHSNGPL